jgi:Tfp pilus assembly protein FimT
VVLAIVGVLCAIAMPTFQNNFSSMHLSAATSAVTGAIQSTRYAAVVNGCQYQIIFSQGTTTYQLARQALNQNTTPPSCPTGEAFSNLGTPVAWAAAPDGISLLASTTLQFAPNGIVSLAGGGSAGCATGALACLKLSNGTTTSTINISGVGNVTVTSP